MSEDQSSVEQDDESGESQGSFSESLEEIEEIVGRIEAEDVDIDLLAEELRRAAVLLEVCRAKIRRAEIEVRNIVESLDESDDDSD
jgi:exodeoxyribonuclease VII small subunit